jgi:hypothetical protein
VARVHEQLLEVERRIAERRLGLGRRLRDEPGELRLVARGADAAAAAARRGLRATSCASSGDTVPSLPGIVGAPARFASCRARALSPIASIASGLGPTQTRPSSRQAAANEAFSARKPYPGWTASAPVFRAAARIASTFR